MSWTLTKEDYRYLSSIIHHPSSIIHQPTAEAVEAIVRQYASRVGVISLVIDPEPEYGPYKLDLYTDSGNFFLMLAKYLEDGEHDVKTISNQRAGAEMIEILGDRYPARSMTKDINFICSCFKEFLRGGNVSESKLVIS
ncbi:hypothetical protein [Pseudomonas sp. AN3A02]|uniref:DUF6911 family protein n=1 Tax=Pseudomonas sp. AN3A02 TaxID=2719587 RepID=UPI001430FCE0|nr:hypothetical protein [Pseudomonas sp. AN3A02]NIL20638.1 hypothetical protein [Pseudomonas sp. AN3A02]